MQLIGYEQTGNLDATFAALADPTRRAILSRLASGEASVTELAEPFAMSQPAISKHLKVLERAGLISRGRDAQRRPRQLQPAPLKHVADWLEHYRQFWTESFDRLDDYLQKVQGRKSRAPKLEIRNLKSQEKKHVRKQSHK
jgi:DNA-binding transcriptional ArsR family regulator